MRIIKDSDIDSSRCASDWKRSFKKKVSVEKRIAHGNRIRMNGRNEIGSRSEVLRAANVDGKINDKKHNNS